MPKKTPKALSDYKNKYPKFDEKELSNEIEKFGIHLPKGQKLFHGVFLEIEKFEFTTRPLSTTFCPYVALRNAESKGKSYERNRIDLLVINIENKKIKAFSYKRKRLRLGHENEILIQKNLTISKKSEKLIIESYPSEKYGQPRKNISAYVIELDVL